MGLISGVKNAVTGVVDFAGDVLDFGASEAAAEQAKAAEFAVLQQALEADKARQFMQDQAEKGYGFIDEGTAAASSALGAGYGQAQFDYRNQNEMGLASLYGGYQQGTGRLEQLMGQGLAQGFEGDPGYQFRLKQGEDAIMRHFSAGGGRGGGDALKALLEHNQNFASNEFNNYANRQMGLGSQLAGMDMGYGAQRAGLRSQYGQGLANLSTGHGGALADLYNQSGTNKANIGMGMSGQNSSLSQAMMHNYDNPVQYAGGETAGRGQGGMNLLTLLAAV